MMRRPAAAPAVDLSGLTFRPLATEPVLETHPAWAPDGNSIAYMAVVDGLSQIFTRSIAGTDHARDHSASNPSWSPDGSALYFNSAGGLWVVGSAGGTPDPVLERAGRYAIHPDGKTIVFQRGAGL
jgi:Tol biopolymer transport system component